MQASAQRTAIAHAHAERVQRIAASASRKLNIEALPQPNYHVQPPALAIFRVECSLKCSELNALRLEIENSRALMTGFPHIIPRLWRA